MGVYRVGLEPRREGESLSRVQVGCVPRDPDGRVAVCPERTLPRLAGLTLVAGCFSVQAGRPLLAHDQGAAGLTDRRLPSGSGGIEAGDPVRPVCKLECVDYFGQSNSNRGYQYCEEWVADPTWRRAQYGVGVRRLGVVICWGPFRSCCDESGNTRGVPLVESNELNFAD